MRTNLVLDDELVKQAFQLTQVNTHQELIHLALQELVQNHQRKSLFELAGQIDFHENYDHKSLRAMR
jgi:Arc/MetJ family transcription regulator